MHYRILQAFSFIGASLSLLFPFPGLAASPDYSPRAIVIGFLGGFVGQKNAAHTEVQLAQRLKDDFPAALQVRIFQNHNGHQAHTEVLRLLDADGDGLLSAGEKQRARIAIYGHSWGASEAINLARTLARDQIPVLLTIQVDSVQKPWEDDALIPANVTQAVNYYQSDGILHGRSQIRAADGSRTRILGNFRFDYKKRQVSSAGFPWYAKILMRPHIEIESDPEVWRKVESLIRSTLVSPAAVAKGWPPQE
jgi:hypothetical protein